MYNGQVRGECMLESKANWIVLNNDKKITEEKRHSNRVSSLVLELLKHRGITTEDDISTFLSPDLNDLHSPNLFAMIELASERIKSAIRDEEIGRASCRERM